MEEKEIRLLDTNTSNQIAAGEVVEKPASVVKELVENSLDAGANNVDISIFEGGTEYIRVADNGSGMSEANLKLAVKRHATSKIRQANDLLYIQTLGFRGEALPSIASVSEFEILSRPKSSEFATSIKINGGKEQETIQTGGALGTTIIVKDLFFNVPARRKFLKTYNTEGRYISELITKLALMRPDVRFKLTNNDKEVLTTPGDGDLKNTISALYGTKVKEELLPVDFVGDNVIVKGYIGKPTLLKGTRQWQTIIVNGRVVNNRMIAKAIDHAYQSQIPKSGFPFAVLAIDVNSETIDVNVHPQKSEIKFSDEGVIYKGVYKALADALAHPMMAAKTTEESVSDFKPSPFTTDSSIVEREKVSGSAGKTSWTPPQQSIFKTNDKEPLYSMSEARDLLKETAISTHFATGEDAPKANAVLMQGSGDAGLDTIWPIGQVDKTFIIAQSEDALYLIDQHAAHERILYDKLVLSNQEVPIQQLLIPQYIDVSTHDLNILEEYKEEFVRLGVDLEPAGETMLRLSSLPADVNASEADEFIAEIAKYLRENKKPTAADLRRDVLHMAACRGAIKAGEVLNTRQMRQIIIDLCNTTHPFTCPHGRPCMIEISSDDLYKMFKRTGF